MDSSKVTLLQHSSRWVVTKSTRRVKRKRKTVKRKHIKRSISISGIRNIESMTAVPAAAAVTVTAVTKGLARRCHS